jgi:acyl-CoA thioesterase-1
VAAIALWFGLSGSVNAETRPLRILAFGASIIAGYGLDAQDALPAQLEKALRARGIDAMVINSGVSGETSAGGLARLDWALADDPDLVIVDLGGNDALRGIDPKTTEANLDAIVARLQQEKRGVLIAGMLAPPNLGADYAAAFNAVFRNVAERHDVVLYPFILDGVVMDPELNQEDGIHPNAAGVKVIVERMLPSVLQAIERLDRRTPGS